uniref:BRX domain-containing protein n=1 Tax=Aegilops tauschii subsp. strangulata TaxID=200361 RepID=A0A453PCC8_AEGTS
GFQPHARNPSASWIPSIGEEAEEDDEEAVVLEEDRVPREWTAQVEPGVHITFVSIPGGAGNDLKRIRFSREMFNKWEAQRWWGENYDRVVELYNVQTFRQQGLSTPSSSIDDAMQADRHLTPWVCTASRESHSTPARARRGRARWCCRRPRRRRAGSGRSPGPRRTRRRATRPRPCRTRPTTCGRTTSTCSTRRRARRRCRRARAPRRPTTRRAPPRRRWTRRPCR